ncbi:MAG TPA: M1 family aminopeptidase [Kofleriaceae bacterium]|nr:M1 family aminopeptidase [Kofleriaceae bacterium]
MRTLLAAVVLLAACSGDDPPPMPTANPSREVVDTNLSFDVGAKTGHAQILFGPSTMPGASLEIGDLAIQTVTQNAQDVPFAVTGSQLDLGLAANAHGSTKVDITYTWINHEMFTGASKDGFTLIWPYYCGNLFPCHSHPDDGTTFELQLAGLPDGMTAVYPTEIPGDAPSYQIAWSINAYTEMPLGTTSAGTQVSIWHLPGEETKAMTGGANLVAAFDWFEKTLGPYTFGTHVGGVSVAWPRGAFGGMEHHPYWHVASAALGSQETQVHEAAHGWFGDGIRIKCWEDFVLSEGTVSYLAARALDVVAPSVGAATWASYQTELGALSPMDKVWPQSCGTVDIIKDDLFTNAPYMRGAFFYKGLADKLGADVVDGILAAFYQQHRGGAATMQDMLDLVHTMTGYDATACAQTWLINSIVPQQPAACP